MYTDIVSVTGKIRSKNRFQSLYIAIRHTFILSKDCDNATETCLLKAHPHILPPLSQYHRVKECGNDKYRDICQIYRKELVGFFDLYGGSKTRRSIFS